MIVCPRLYRLETFGHIVHRYKNVLFSLLRWKRPDKVNPPKIKNLYLKDGLQGHFISL